VRHPRGGGVSFGPGVAQADHLGHTAGFGRSLKVRSARWRIPHSDSGEPSGCTLGLDRATGARCQCLHARSRHKHAHQRGRATGRPQACRDLRRTVSAMV
jgi:hypothetical protein